MIYIITGQTATGKTKRAFELAAKHNGEIINCDSRQIYKKLDIITGKDLSLTDRKYVVYKKRNDFDIGYYSAVGDTRLWLYDIVSPKQPFSAFDYRILVLEVLKDLELRKKTPIIVGGTYFYLQHLLYDILDSPVPPDPKLRAELEQYPTELLQHLLAVEAPHIYSGLNDSEKANRQRLIRKIEVIRSGHILPQKKQQEYDFAPPFFEQTIEYEGYHFAEKKRLREVIKKRVEDRVGQGAIAEVENLLRQGYTGQEPGLQTIGYVQIMQYLQGNISKKEMEIEWLTRELQYAKRQYTFAKRDPNIVWIEV